MASPSRPTFSSPPVIPVGPLLPGPDDAKLGWHPPPIARPVIELELEYDLDSADSWPPVGTFELKEADQRVAQPAVRLMYAVHMRCACGAHAVHMHVRCTCSAHAVHMYLCRGGGAHLGPVGSELGALVGVVERNVVPL